MNSLKCSLLLLIAILIGPASLNADVFVDFRDITGTVGDALESGGLNNPVVVDAVNAPGLTITATAITAAVGNTSAVIFADTGDFAVNSSGGPTDDPDGFDDGESITLQFNQTVAINTLDFNLGSGETISFGGINFVSGESPLPGVPVILGAGIVDLSANPIIIAANTDFVVGDVSVGTVSLQDLDLTVIPEPTSAFVILGLGICGLSRRRR